jgi:hypothetical protein
VQLAQKRSWSTGAGATRDVREIRWRGIALLQSAETTFGAMTLDIPRAACQVTELSVVSSKTAIQVRVSSWSV